MIRSFLCIACFSVSMLIVPGCGGSDEPAVVEAEVPTEQDMADYEAEMEAPVVEDK